MGRTLQDNANIFIYSSPPYAAAQEERAGDWWEARRFGGGQVQVSQRSSDALGCRWGKPGLYRNKEKVCSGQQGVQFWCLNEQGVSIC